MQKIIVSMSVVENIYYYYIYYYNNRTVHCMGGGGKGSRGFRETPFWSPSMQFISGVCNSYSAMMQLATYGSRATVSK